MGWIWVVQGRGEVCVVLQLGVYAVFCIVDTCFASDGLRYDHSAVITKGMKL